MQQGRIRLCNLVCRDEGLDRVHLGRAHRLRVERLRRKCEHSLQPFECLLHRRLGLLCLPKSPHRGEERVGGRGGAGGGVEHLAQKRHVHLGDAHVSSDRALQLLENKLASGRARQQNVRWLEDRLGDAPLLGAGARRSQRLGVCSEHRRR